MTLMDATRADLALTVTDRWVKAARIAVEGGDFERALSATLGAERALERAKLSANACLNDPEYAASPDSPPLESLASARMLDTLNAIWLEVHSSRNLDDPMAQVIARIIEERLKDES